jgi:hypothetical protein
MGWLGKGLKKIGKVVGKVATGDLIGAAGTVIGAVAGSKGSKKAAKASAAGHQASAAEQRAALGQVGGYQRPYLDAGTGAINALMQVNSGNYSGFENSPDYIYARDQALRGVERSAAARGGLYSGNTGLELARHAGGIASQNIGNYRNALFNTIGIGQGAANVMTGATLDNAAGVGRDLVGAGDARASGIVGSTNALTGGIEDLAGLAGDRYGNSLLKKPKAPKKMQRLPSVTVPY